MAAVQYDSQPSRFGLMRGIGRRVTCFRLHLLRDASTACRHPRPVLHSRPPLRYSPNLRRRDGVPTTDSSPARGLQGGISRLVAQCTNLGGGNIALWIVLHGALHSPPDGTGRETRVPLLLNAQGRQSTGGGAEEDKGDVDESGDLSGQVRALRRRSRRHLLPFVPSRR